MRRWTRGLLPILGCSALAVAAAPSISSLLAEQRKVLRVVVEGLSGGPPAGSVLLLRQLASRPEDVAPTGAIPESAVALSSASVELEMPPVTWWQVEGTIPGHWLAPSVLGAGDDEVRLRAIPTAAVRMEPAVPRGDALPEELMVRFAEANHGTLLRFGSEPVRRPDDLLRGEAVCHREEPPLWRCDLPAAVPLDLRFNAPGFASAFRRSVAVSPGEVVDLGRLTLIQGGSVLGWVELPTRGVLEPRDVEVALAPDTLDSDDPTASLLERTARLEDDGRFQFRELEPGYYRVAVRSRGWATAAQGSIEVLPGRETELKRSLALVRPAALEVCLSPVDPPGLRLPGDTWQPVLYSEAGALREAVPDCLSEPGCYHWSDLQPGPYRLAIEDGRASLWWERRLSVAEGETRLEQQLPLVPLRGTITRGGQPVRARLVFRKVLPAASDQLAGECKIVLYSSPQGTFDGALPAEGDWWVNVAFGTAGAEQPLGPVKVDRTGDDPAVVQLVMAESRLRGRVVNPRDEGIRSARVEIVSLPIDERAGTAAIGSAVTDEQGRFEFSALFPGRYELSAAADGGTRAEVDLEESASQTLKLMVPEGSVLTGRVVSHRGPVPGATVIAHVERDSPARQRPLTAVSDGAGEFVLAAPSDSSGRHLDLVILPPGHAARVFRVATGPGRPLFVPVDMIGGDLALRAGAGDEGLNGARLVAGGASVDLSTLESWSRLGTDPATDLAWTLPMMTAGEYSLCRGGGGSCDSGVLEPFGTLVLHLPLSPVQ